MRAGNAFDDGQTQPVALRARGIGAPEERPEQLAEIAFGHAGAVVANLDHSLLPLFAAQAEQDLAAVGTELHRVRQQIVDSPFEQAVIAADRQRIRHLQRDADLPGVSLDAEDACPGLQQRGQIDLFQGHAGQVRFHSRQRQRFADDPVQPGDLGLGSGEVAGGGFGRAAAGEIEQQMQAGQRRAQFVGNVLQHAAFVRALSLLMRAAPRAAGDAEPEVVDLRAALPTTVVTGQATLTYLAFLAVATFLVASPIVNDFLMRLMIAESNRFPDFMRSVANSIFARFRQNIRRMFNELEAAGLIPAGDHNRSAALFGDIVLGSSPIMTYTSWATSPPDETDKEERIEFFILGRYGPQIAEMSKIRQAERQTQS